MSGHIESIKGRLAKDFGEAAVGLSDRAKTGYDVTVKVEAKKIPDLARLMAAEGRTLEYITAVDRGKNLELVYMFGVHTPAAPACRVKATVECAKGQAVPSISGIIPAADWHERETFDLLGQKFSGHPDLKRILLPEDADFHPLLKDFVSPEDEFNEEFSVCFN